MGNGRKRHDGISYPVGAPYQYPLLHGDYPRMWPGSKITGILANVIPSIKKHF
jgi:hypothetical protein